MINKIKEDFEIKMMYLYADRDAYSRGKIIELAKEYLAEAIDKNLNLPHVKKAKRPVCKICDAELKEGRSFNNYCSIECRYSG